MQTILKAVGDSTVAVIPEDMLNQLGFEASDNLEIAVENGRLVVTKTTNPSRTDPC
jgi:antitoxin component of MazEF toxin-antitoxin module